MGSCQRCHQLCRSLILRASFKALTGCLANEALNIYNGLARNKERIALTVLKSRKVFSMKNKKQSYLSTYTYHITRKKAK